MFLPSLEGGGGERVGLLIAEALIDAGFAVEVPVACKTGTYARHELASTHVIDLGAPNELLCLPHFLRYYDRSKPDLVVAVLHTAKITTGLAAKLRPDLRFMLSVHHDLPSHPFWTRRLFGYRFERWLDRKALHAHVVARAMAPQITAFFGIAQERVSTVLNASQHEHADGAIAPEHEAIFDRPVIMTAGRMVDQKNHDMLIDAFHRAGIAHDVRLLILGDGKNRRALERQVARLGLGDSVAMPGFVPDVRPYMRRARCFVLPSRSEGLGIVLLEALASGVPVAAFDCPVGPREVLQDGKLGRLIPAGDVAGLICALRDAAAGRIAPADPADVAAMLALVHVDAVKRGYVAMVRQALEMA